MTHEEPSSDGERISAEVEQAVQADKDVQDTVRRITLNALTRGELDTQSMRRVATAVMHGVSLGAAGHGAKAREAVSKATAGLDEAFAKAAEAATLAVKEAHGRAREFGSNDLKRAVDDIRGYESIYVDSLRTAAKGTRDLVAATLQSFADHASNSGTAVGRQIQSSLADLGGELGRTAQAQLRDNLEAGKATAATLARIGAGLLAGIAESMDPKKPGSKSHTGGESGKS